MHDEPSSGDLPATGDAARRGLYSALSREMCRPLISIRAGFDLLLAGCEGPLAPGQRDQVQALRGQCDSLIGMTRSFLDYASSREEKPIELESFRLGALLDETGRRFACRARARGVDWSCGLAGPDGPVLTDINSLQQILGRLVENALEQTAEGGRIEVSGRVEVDGWAVDVVDDGRGIAPAALEMVFEPLTRLGGPAGPSPVCRLNLGMGLAICRALIDRLGGTISIRSEPGRGTQVSLRFPA